jgi:hypothetical protein
MYIALTNWTSPTRHSPFINPARTLTHSNKAKQKRQKLREAPEKDKVVG